MRQALIWLCFALLCLSAIPACNSPEEIKKKKFIAEGMILYQNHCQNCHQPSGKGFENLIPPLNDNNYLLQNRTRLACIIRYGMEETIVINGKTYDQPMVPNERLTAMEIAEILTYITNAFGNRQKMFAVKEVEQALQSCAPVRQDSL